MSRRCEGLIAVAWIQSWDGNVYAVRALCGGADVGFTLDEPQQGALVVALTLGTDRVYCARFGGLVRADRSVVPTGRGSFVARSAPPPVACPLP